MDLPWVRREVRKIYIAKCAQAGVSEAIRNVKLHLALFEPDPVLLVLPDEKTGKRVMGKRILPLFEDTPALKALKTETDRDQGLTKILLANGFELQLGWSGSPATMAADPARVVCVDETDKIKEWTGKEAGVMELVDVRTTHYDNSIVYAYSTPTIAEGPIWTMAEQAEIKLHFLCPCPKCGHYQRMAWEQVRYPKPGDVIPPEMEAWEKIDAETWERITTETEPKKRAGLIEQNRASWFECERCKCAILDHQRQRMLLAGCWSTEDGGWQLFLDGSEKGTWPGGSEVAMYYPATLSLAPKHRYSKMAAEWIRCDGNPQRTQGFRNSWLGEPFKILTQKSEPDVIRRKKDTAPAPMIVPAWTRLLSVTADVQGNDPATGYFYYTIRAWGYSYRSQLIDYGIVNTFDELWSRSFERPIPFETGGTVVPQTMLIDSGNRSNEVYQFVLRDPSRIKPTKGANQRLSWPVEKKRQAASGVILWLIDTEQTKDLLNRLIYDPDPLQWQVHSQINDDYCHQVASEHKVVNRKRNREMWEKKTVSTPNHLLDCEQQQCAAAYDFGCGMEEPKPATSSNQADTEGFVNPLTSHRGKW